MDRANDGQCKASFGAEDALTRDGEMQFKRTALSEA